MSSDTSTGRGVNISEILFDLESEVEDVRKAAVAWLANSGDRSAIEPLKRLTNDPSVSIRFFARKAIAAIEKRHPGGVSRAPSPAAGPSAATGSGGTADLAAWAVRLRDLDPDTRLQAVLDTYSARLEGLLPLLTAMLEAEEEVTVRSALVSAVGRYQDPGTLQLLFRFLDDGDSRVRANTIDALARFQDPNVMQQIVRLSGDPDNRVQANLARALGQFDPQFLHDQVQAMLGSGTQWMRESALYVLWAVRDDWCRGELDVIASDASEEPEFRDRARQFPEGLARLSRPIQLKSLGDPTAPVPVPEPQLDEGFQLPEDLAANEPSAPDPEGDLTVTDISHRSAVPPPGPVPSIPAPPDLDASLLSAVSARQAAPDVSLASEAPVATVSPADPATPAPDAGLQEIPEDRQGLLDMLGDKSPPIRLAVLAKLKAFDDDDVWQRIEMLSMDRDDEVREEARRLLRGRYGEDSVEDLSTIALSMSKGVSVSELRRANQEAAAAEAGGAAQPVGDGSSQSSKPRSRVRRTASRASRVSVSAANRVAPVPARADEGGQTWKIAAGAGVFGLLLTVGLIFSGGGDSSRPSATKQPAAGGGSKLARVAKAKDLGKYIGHAIPLKGKLVEVNSRKDRFIVETAHGKIAVQFVRPVTKAPAVGEAVEVDGVLLGRTRERFVLLRGRKIRKSQ